MNVLIGKYSKIVLECFVTLSPGETTDLLHINEKLDQIHNFSGDRLWFHKVDVRRSNLHTITPQTPSQYLRQN